MCFRGFSPIFLRVIIHRIPIDRWVSDVLFFFFFRIKVNKRDIKLGASTESDEERLTARTQAHLIMTYHYGKLRICYLTLSSLLITHWGPGDKHLISGKPNLRRRSSWVSADTGNYRIWRSGASPPISEHLIFYYDRTTYSIVIVRGGTTSVSCNLSRKLLLVFPCLRLRENGKKDIKKRNTTFVRLRPS